ncbi:hypothetical protein CYMTET_11262 [Cymbomonas tetramitiformis]|uniref:Uncharacterized protein n=1 Tax=Cymbomonas tetramitiformis TaxID=36881 RepID=A0AAE0LD04_9CHLO|nr:hypothetical protein CYMTET_11262 [Cymbomonas tetramitiformis]
MIVGVPSLRAPIERRRDGCGRQHITPAPPTSSPVCSGVADDACVKRPREGMAVAQTTNSKQTARDVRAENPKPIGGLPHPKARRGGGRHSSSSSESSAATETEYRNIQVH